VQEAFILSVAEDVRICYVFSPDDSGLVTTEKVFWCILLEEKQLPEVSGSRDMPK